jgi:hypothetical protein
MDTDTLVADVIEDGQKLVEELLRHGIEVTAAFWLKPSWDGKWRFYLVSPAVDAEGPAQVYQRMHPVLWGRPQPFWIHPLEINLIGPSDPIAQDVLAALRRIPGPLVRPMRWRGRTLGRLIIEDAYLYPLPPARPG